MRKRTICGAIKSYTNPSSTPTSSEAIMKTRKEHVWDFNSQRKIMRTIYTDEDSNMEYIKDGRGYRSWVKYDHELGCLDTTGHGYMPKKPKKRVPKPKRAKR